MAAELGPSGWRNADIAAVGRSEGTSCAARMDGHVNSGNGPTLYGEAMDGGYDCPAGLRPQETRAMPTKTSPNCVGGGADEGG